MRKYKLDGTDISVSVSHVDEKYNFSICFFDEKSGKLLDMLSFGLPSAICKSQFNDSNLVRHILNFFIKDI